MAHTYSHLYGLPAPPGPALFHRLRPLGPCSCSPRRMLAGEPNEGRIVRDFIYVDDITESLLRVLDKPATPDPASS